MRWDLRAKARSRAIGALRRGPSLARLHMPGSDTPRKRDFALQMIRPQHPNSRMLLERLMRMARSSVNHPNAVGYEDFDCCDDGTSMPYVAMLARCVGKRATSLRARAASAPAARQLPSLSARGSPVSRRQRAAGRAAPGPGLPS
jgi:hypothetical protein